MRVSSARRKRLGQYFTGAPVSRLLATLAGAESAASIVDPMVGSGDLLAACLESGASPKVLCGVDLDATAVHQARSRLPGRDVRLSAGNAFITRFPPNQFDLVITNPPYVRYQSDGLDDDAVGVRVPTVAEVRSGLIAFLQGRPGLSPAARDLLLNTAKSYPGTADLAVPSWVLCAGLVSESGTLAMVVPQAWLTRNYASGVREMLSRAFHVEFVVEDGDASWFPDAQVRTHLLVARRKPVDVKEMSGRGTVVARATHDLARHGRLVGDLASEREVHSRLALCAAAEDEAVTSGLTARRAPWRTESHQVHPSLQDLVGGEVASSLTTLEGLGWGVGQGLRTGANDFFYLEDIAGRLRTGLRWGSRLIDAPPEAVLPALRRQTDLNGSLQVRSASLPHRLLYLRGWVTAADRNAATARGLASSRTTDRVLPHSLSDWITEASRTPVGPARPDIRFPDLTAVAPNARKGRNGEPTAYWYQLPLLARRHRPSLFSARVCGGRPTVSCNPDHVVVDANFSSLWPTSAQATDAHAVMALLNSTWAWVNLELGCAVLGGGALKVEAADLRRLRLPRLDADAVGQLSSLGDRLAVYADTALIAEIDAVVATLLGGSGHANVVRDRLRALGRTMLERRAARTRGILNSTEVA